MFFLSRFVWVNVLNRSVFIPRCFSIYCFPNSLVQSKKITTLWGLCKLTNNSPIWTPLDTLGQTPRTRLVHQLGWSSFGGRLETTKEHFGVQSGTFLRLSGFTRKPRIMQLFKFYFLLLRNFVKMNSHPPKSPFRFIGKTIHEM